jgi:hypothetical protein
MSYDLLVLARSFDRSLFTFARSLTRLHFPFYCEQAQIEFVNITISSKLKNK